jgi:hypothetical protein
VTADHDGDWSIRPQGIWYVVQPASRRLPAQGWKLHLSATPASVVELLDRAVPVLVAERCTFKFAAGPESVHWLNSARCPRSMAGKFLTVYPADDEQFRRLAAALDRATADLAGPEILSDRRYRPGSVVHYRFGGFTNSSVLDDDGCYRPVIVGPAGEAVEDRREAWFAPPPWAAPVLPGQQPTPPVDRPKRVLVGGRFVVLRALRHSNRGGVFEGYDRRTGTTVVVKQARAHVEIDPSGRDCRDRLRHEADLLARLAATGLAPRVVDVVEEADHVFLVRELIPATTVRRWVTRQVDAGGVPPGAGLSMAAALVRLVDAVHRIGLVLVDLSPNNILVDERGALWLIDLDHSAEAGQLVYPVGTPGYTPPEHLADDGRGVVARPAADLFGLGGLLFLIAVGTDPTLATDEPGGRPVQDRVRAWLDMIRSDLPLVDMLAAPVLGLMRQQPAARWRPERVARSLDRPHRNGGLVRPRPEMPGLDRLVWDGVAWLRAELTPDGARLWPPGRFGADTDPCAVQHGAAGVLAALLGIVPHATDSDLIRDVVSLTCRWIEERLPAEPRLLPGLYFGRSGTAWALYDAARLLGDPRLAAVALDLAARLPVRWANPDVAHGLAGAGMAHLHLWWASGDQRFESRMRACADGLVEAAHQAGADIGWPIPRTLRSKLAGRTYHGYAHGTAGVGAFLLAAGAATQDRGYTQLACRAADALAQAAVLHDGAARWPTGPGSDTLAGAGWCTGSAGIGMFLLRAWQITGEPRQRDLARAAALAIHRARGRSNTAACHGLAGGGQFLLDLAATLDEPMYRRWAENVAAVMAAKAVRRGGRLLVADETGLAVVADFGVGLAGALAFVARLRHGGPQPWTVESENVRAIGAREIPLGGKCDDHC